MDNLEKQAIELDAKRPKHDLKLVNLATVAPRNMEWLWYGRFPLGKLSLLGGIPSTGKTTIVQDMIERVSTGTKFPFTDVPVTAGDVLILTAEDDAADTIVPRLMAAGADLLRVHLIKSVAFLDDNTGNVNDKQLVLSRDMEQLKALLKEMPGVRLIVFDPLSAYLGADDSHRDADVRQVLGPLSELASDYKVAVIGITHLNKMAGGEAMARFMGSTGIIAAARAAYMTVEIDDEYVMVNAKGNLTSKKNAQGLTYDIVSETVYGTEGEEIYTSRIEWTGLSDMNANDALNSQKEQRGSPKLTAAKQFLESYMAMGPKKQTEIEADAISQGHSIATIRRAKNELGINSHKDRFTGGWKWYTEEQYKSLISIG
jgi:putative DNA primase/helicase